MNTSRSKRWLAALLAAAFAITEPASAGTIGVLSVPLEMSGVVYPNVIFGLDDSGSMDFETLMPTTDGEIWWDATNKRFDNGSNGFYDNTNGADYIRLFPIGTASDAAPYYTDAGGYYAVPPIPAYAFARSSDYNPMYYNPAITYAPWAPDWSGSGTTTETFAAANASAARSHPIFSGGTTLNLSAVQSSTAANYTFKMQSGMTIPGSLTVNGGTYNAQRWNSSNSTWVTVTSNYSVTSSTNVNVPYYPATYWVKTASCAVGVNGATTGDCVQIFDGSWMRRYEIRSTYSGAYPSGRSYSDELQNFANWFTYYRKRKLLLAASMGAVLPALRNVRLGITRYNSLSTVSMFDQFTAGSASYVANTNPSTNALAVLYQIYRNPANSGTPGRQTLKYIGDQFKRSTNSPPIRSGYPYWGECSVNAAMLLTDGYADSTSTTPPAYSSSPYFSSAPFNGILSGAMADIASSYYANNLRTDLTAGLVIFDSTQTAPSADKNPNLHMNTYGLTLGAKGDIFGQTDTQAHINSNTDPYTYPPTWPTSISQHDPAAIDDMWHATINGRGKLFTATDTATVSSAVNAMLAAIVAQAGGGTKLTVSNQKPSPGDNILYESSYNSNSWYGELIAGTVDVDTGAVNTTTPQWSFRTNLNAMDWTTRKIATYSNSTGTPGGSGVAWSSATTPTPASLRNWIAGDRSLEGTTYRQRAYVLGDISNSQPVLVKGSTNVIYQVANDGMVHAVDAANGQELWAYVPGLVLPNISQISTLGYLDHVYVLDGTPTVGQVGTEKVLIGGMREGGKGYYALDVTTPTASSSSDVASKVLWELKDANMGFSYGPPVITTLAYGTVALLTSGYNNADGKGHLYVVNPLTGAIIRDLSNNSGSASSPSGLAFVSVFTKFKAGGSTISDVAYGGDLNGDLWRFDLSSANPSQWSVSRLATTKDASGLAQPITAAPELSIVASGTSSYRIVMVGTGKLLELTDLTNNNPQTVYGIVDNMSGTAVDTGGTLRSVLQQQTMTVGTGGVRTASSTVVDYTKKKGWYIDLPTGEMMTTSMTLNYGILSFTTSNPDLTQGCHGALSYLYQVDFTTGGQLAQTYFGSSTPFAGQSLGSAYASAPTGGILTQTGKLVTIVHETNGQIVGSTLTPNNIRTVKRVSWSEILR